MWNYHIMCEYAKRIMQYYLYADKRAIQYPGLNSSNTISNRKTFLEQCLFRCFEFANAGDVGLLVSNNFTSVLQISYTKIWECERLLIFFLSSVTFVLQSCYTISLLMITLVSCRSDLVGDVCDIFLWHCNNKISLFVGHWFSDSKPSTF